MIRAVASIFAYLILSGPAFAMPGITWELRNIEASPNPAPSVIGGPATIKAAVTIKPMGSMGMATEPCEAEIDFGNGTAPRRELLGGTGKVRYEFDVTYPKPGEYTLNIKGAPGPRGCVGKKSSKVEVLIATPEAASAAAAEVAKVKSFVYTATTKNPVTEVRQPRQVSAECPKGWTLVPGSQHGPRFSCKVLPVEPLQCETGSSYFESENVIGCR